MAFVVESCLFCGCSHTAGQAVGAAGVNVIDQVVVKTRPVEYKPAAQVDLMSLAKQRMQHRSEILSETGFNGITMGSL